MKYKTIRKTLIPYSPLTQSIGGCTDIGQVCEVVKDDDKYVVKDNAIIKLD